MSQYTRDDKVVEATQWFKHGDHPEVTLPPVGTIMYNNNVYGVIRKEPFTKRIVFPGDWIVEYDHTTDILSNDLFQMYYKPLTPIRIL